MVLDFDVQMGVAKIPDLTADGRDGFSSRAQHDWCVERYLGGMCDKKRGKALIDKSMYDRILVVLFDKNDKTTESAQFRWWVRRTFTKVSDDRGHYLVHENRPLAVKEQIYDILVYCHAECGHGGRDKTSAVSRKYFSWIPKDVVSRFVSVCPGCHARTQKDERFFSNKGADGYYPVNDQVRELSIARGHATPESYSKTSPYQPLLAAGMVKLLNGVNNDEETTVGTLGFDGDEASSVSQNSHLSPFDITGHDQSQSSTQDSSIRAELLESVQPASRVPSPHPQSTHDLQNNLEREAVANAQAVMEKVALKIKASEVKHLKSDQHKIQSTKLAKASKLRAPKTSRKTQVRKPTSKPKVHKKAILTEPIKNPLPSSSVCSDSLPRLQEDSSATSTSEDDNTSKSEIASPTQFYSRFPPRFDYSIQSFSGGIELNSRKHHEGLSPDHEVDLNHPTSHYNNTNLLGLDHLQTPIPCVDVMDNMMLQGVNQSTQGWKSAVGSEAFNLQDPSYGTAYQASIHEVSDFQSSSTPNSNDTANAGIHSQEQLSFQQYAQLVDQHNNDSIDHNSAGIEFTFQSVQSSAPESQLCHSLTPLHTSTPLSWSLSAPTNGGIGDRFNGMLQSSPHPSFLTDDNTQYQDMLNATGSQGSPYMSEISVDYSHQLPQLAAEQTKHRPPMLQLPSSQFSLDPSQNGPRSAPLLGGHFDYAQRTEPNFINYPYSAGFDGHFDFHSQNQYPYSIDPTTLTQDYVGTQFH
ncbi:hypothetical protein DFH28DRAFT_1027045 [Melampsora americana]|nr:hypothetical protein DFH28DRAFT_1027045 [Melampsora americana]